MEKPNHTVPSGQLYADKHMHIEAGNELRHCGEIGSVQLAKTYCLLSLLYAFEVWSCVYTVT